MKIANIELTKENMILAVAIAIVAIVLILDIVFYLPLTRQIKAGYIECKNCESEVLQTRSLIESAGRNCGERTLLTEKEVSFAIDEFTKHGKAMGVNFISITPREIIEDKSRQYKILPIEMEIEGPDQRVSSFIGSWDELKKALIKVKSLDIAPNPEDKTRLTAKMTVDLYITGRDYEE